MADTEQVLELRLDARDLDTMFAKKKLDPEELNTAMAKTLQDLFVNSERHFSRASLCFVKCTVDAKQFY